MAIERCIPHNMQLQFELLARDRIKLQLKLKVNF